jgi:hypothetical protein
MFTPRRRPQSLEGFSDLELSLLLVDGQLTPLHHERVILAKEIQKLRTERKAILDLLGVKEAEK